MSIVNKVKNFFSRNYISHYDGEGNLKDFEHFRIDLVKELDYMVLRHKFHVREKLSTAGLYNLVQSSLGDITEDFQQLDPFKLAYDSFFFIFYSTTLAVDLFTIHKVNLISWCYKISERFSSPGAFIWGPKVSEFHWHGYMLDDPYHYPPEFGYYGREYEDLIRASSLDFYHNHKKMIEYDNSSYVKLTVISFTDIIEDSSMFLNSSFASLWDFMFFRIYPSWYNLTKSAEHLFNIFYDIAACGVYSICSVFESFPIFFENIFKIIENIVISVEDNIKYYTNDKISELFKKDKKYIDDKYFDIVDNSINLSNKTNDQLKYSNLQDLSNSNNYYFDLINSQIYNAKHNVVEASYDIYDNIITLFGAQTHAVDEG